MAAAGAGAGAALREAARRKLRRFSELRGSRRGAPRMPGGGTGARAPGGCALPPPGCCALWGSGCTQPQLVLLWVVGFLVFLLLLILSLSFL